MLLNILFVIALTFPVAVSSTAFNIVNKEQCTIDKERHVGRNLMYALILALGQGVMYCLGGMLGGTFMHLMERLSKWIVFALCFSIAYRMSLNTLKIRKGENLYFVQNYKQIILLSIALGVNAFIAGLMYDFFSLFQNLTPYILIAVSFVWSVASMLIPFSKMKLTFNSLLNLISAAIILVTGFIGLM